MQSPIPTTYGHQTDEVVWFSDNGIWYIQHRTVYARNGEVRDSDWYLCNTRDRETWPINANTASTDFCPKYIRQAIHRHVTEEVV